MTATALRRGLTLALACLLTGATLTGCGLRDTVVGIRPAPTESSAGTPLTVDAATTITARVLHDVAAAEVQTGEAGTAARQSVMTGTALAVSLAALQVGATAQASKPPVERPDDPMILGLSQGTAWPRAILATTLDPQTNTRWLYALTSASAAEPFVLAARVPMLAGASLPSLGETAQGVEVVPADDAAGLVLGPGAAVSAYAAALAFPAPTTPDPAVATTDSYATAQASAAATQASALGTLATYTIAHTAVSEETLAFRLAAGGVVVFGRMNRVDSIAVTAEAQSISIPESLQSLVGGATTAQSLQVDSIEAVTLVIPATGAVSAIGAQDQRARGTTT